MYCVCFDAAHSTNSERSGLSVVVAVDTRAQAFDPDCSCLYKGQCGHSSCSTWCRLQICKHGPTLLKKSRQLRKAEAEQLQMFIQRLVDKGSFIGSTLQIIKDANFASLDAEYFELKDFYVLNPTVAGIAKA